MARTILVALDGSPGSEVAFAHGADLARTQGATLILLHVVAPIKPMLMSDGQAIAYADQVAARIAYDVRAYLTGLAATRPDVVAEAVVRFGDPAEEILAEAAHAGVSLIAMATHRRHGLRHLVDGSVAERVERASPVPVLLVRCEKPAAIEPKGRRVHRRFWCAWSRRDVEVEFVERGLPGLPWAVAVRGCSAFDPPIAIECQRRCLNPDFRRQWEPPLPVLGAEQSATRGA